MLPGELERQLQADASGAGVPVALVANAGTTSAGAIDPLRAIGSIARRYGVWFHVDGAYGLPGVLDPRGQIDAPTVDYVGEHDKRSPASASVFEKYMAVRANLTNADAGHSVHKKRPGEIAAAIRRLLDELPTID